METLWTEHKVALKSNQWIPIPSLSLTIRIPKILKWIINPIAKPIRIRDLFLKNWAKTGVVIAFPHTFFYQLDNLPYPLTDTADFSSFSRSQ